MRGGLLSATTIICAILFVGSVAMVVGGTGMKGDDGVALIMFGVILGSIFGIAGLVSFSHDYSSSTIQSAATAHKAYQRFLVAVRSGRAHKAFAARAPTARKAGSVPTGTFEHIPPNTGRYEIRNAATLKKYWRSVFRGPSLQTRSVRIKSVLLSRETPNDVAVVHAELQFLNYPSLLILTILINLIVCAILIAVLQKKTPVSVRKVLIRRNERWYIAEGEFEGKVDTLSKLVK